MSADRRGPPARAARASRAAGAGGRAVPAALIAAFTSTLAGARAVLAATPTPTAAAGGDPRSSGQGPGLVGDPLLAIGLVLLIGAVALGLTLAWVRATGGPRRS